MPADFDSDEENDSMIRVGGVVDNTSVSLLISGDTLDPTEVTQLLGFPPTESWRKGDVRNVGKSGKSLALKTGRWTLDSPRGQGDLDKHITWILDVLTSDPQAWAWLKTRYDLDLYCGLFIEEWHRGTCISAHSMLELGKRGIELGLHIYAILPDDEEY